MKLLRLNLNTSWETSRYNYESGTGRAKFSGQNSQCYKQAPAIENCENPYYTLFVAMKRKLLSAKVIGISLILAGLTSDEMLRRVACIHNLDKSFALA